MQAVSFIKVHTKFCYASVVTNDCLTEHGLQIRASRRTNFQLPQHEDSAMILNFRREQVYPSFHVLSARRRKHPFPLPGLKAGVIQIKPFQDCKMIKKTLNQLIKSQSY